MPSMFRVGFALDPEIIRDPPPQYRNPRRVFCPVGIGVGSYVMPGPGWCDLTGVLLLEWCRAVWQLSAEESRYARLNFFDTPAQVWIRRTPSKWWKVSAIVRQGNQKRIEAEVLCLPERVEAALLSAAQRFLAGVRAAGVWGVDCEQLAEFVSEQFEPVA